MKSVFLILNAEADAGDEKGSMPTLSMPQARVLKALMQQRWIRRQEIDQIAGKSNGPDVIMKLRRKGLSIFCSRQQALDRDGQPCHPGRYRLEAVSRGLAARLLLNSAPQFLPKLHGG